MAEVKYAQKREYAHRQIKFNNQIFGELDDNDLCFNGMPYFFYKQIFIFWD